MMLRSIRRAALIGAAGIALAFAAAPAQPGHQPAEPDPEAPQPGEEPDQPAVFVAAGDRAVDLPYPAASQSGPAHRLRHQPDRSGIPTYLSAILRRIDVFPTTHRRCADALAEFTRRPPGRSPDSSRRGAIAGYVAHPNERARIVGPSGQSAVGILQASQAGNQLIALQTRQLVDLTALIAAQARAQSLDGARNTANQEQGRVQINQFLNISRGYQPQTVQMFHQ
jgi:hypothetical protein